jgi:hypothetical protein
MFYVGKEIRKEKEAILTALVAMENLITMSTEKKWDNVV